MHGGTSRGPSEAGKQRLSELHMIHGNYTRDERRNTARYNAVVKAARELLKKERS
jgi:hypothetical protein